MLLARPISLELSKINARSQRILRTPRRPTNHPQGRTGGDNRDRTGDLLLAKQALSQLSYIPCASLDELGGPKRS